MIEKMATTEEIQERLFYIAKEIVKVLEKHGIPYSLAFGTLLGAVRHKDFIPWDEDFDLWLFDDSYDEAKHFLRNELPSDLFLEDDQSEPLYFHEWAHVKDLNSYVTPSKYLHDDSYQHKGLLVDLHRLTGVKESQLWNYLNSENKRYIERRKELGLMDDEEYKKRIEQLNINIKSHASFENPIDEDVYALVAPYKCKRIYKKYVFPLVKYQFKDSFFWGINNYDAVLSDIYGNYMVPIPPEERDGGHDLVKIYI
jgi:lipopolysaccharide cholinephosphotransferase